MAKTEGGAGGGDQKRCWESSGGGGRGEGRGALSGVRRPKRRGLPSGSVQSVVCGKVPVLFARLSGLLGTQGRKEQGLVLRGSTWD